MPSLRTPPRLLIAITLRLTTWPTTCVIRSIGALSTASRSPIRLCPRQTPCTSLYLMIVLFSSSWHSSPNLWVSSTLRMTTISATVLPRLVMHFLLCGGAISYRTKPKSITATSPTEAEFHAAVFAAKHAKYLLAVVVELTPIYEDNVFAITMINARPHGLSTRRFPVFCHRRRERARRRCHAPHIGNRQPE